MKVMETAWLTTLPTAEVASVFRQTAEDLFQSPSRRVLAAMPLPGRSRSKFEFFTPQEHPNDSPFSAFEEEPAFCVGVTGPQGGKANAAVAITIQLYVYEEPDGRRLVKFYVPFGRLEVSKGKASSHIKAFVKGLLAADSKAVQKS